MRLSQSPLRLYAHLIFQISACALILPADAISAPAECSDPESHEFDFWVGEWAIKQKILQADGSWFEAGAATKVSPILDGCALMEEWQGQVLFFWEGMKKPEAMKGFSVRGFDPLTKEWVLSWMDSRHRRFVEFAGIFKDGRGEFFRKQPGENGQETTTRITFAEITPVSVRWELAVRSGEAKGWKTLWIMEMIRRNATSPTDALEKFSPDRSPSLK